ncbi:hypothetical protein L195_g014410 [Trifolium pratense]|uniref:Uncharacterized protein n=1 Tax=Trifolium pratense TaxID=57577 RepID=A0A2K3PQV2_TRIPR|nr:hypothetical protein L195_g014410 [Trifolium pratense]
MLPRKQAPNTEDKKHYNGNQFNMNQCRPMHKRLKNNPTLSTEVKNSPLYTGPAITPAKVLSTAESYNGQQNAPTILRIGISRHTTSFHLSFRNGNCFRPKATGQ